VQVIAPFTKLPKALLKMCPLEHCTSRLFDKSSDIGENPREFKYCIFVSSRQSGQVSTLLTNLLNALLKVCPLEHITSKLVVKFSDIGENPREFRYCVFSEEVKNYPCLFPILYHKGA
jgi:hypothetical protein